VLRHFNDNGDNVWGAGDSLLSEFDNEVLASGKRKGVSETLNYDSDGTPETHTTQVDWFNDNIGRLTLETCFYT